MRTRVAGVLLLLIGCAPREQADLEAVTVAAQKIWNRYSATLEAGDLEGWLSLWTDDGIQMPPGEPAVVGKDRIRVRNKAVLDQFTFHIGITNEEVAATGDWAFARGTYTATLTPKAGGKVLAVDGKYLTILQRQPDGSWKIHRDIFNSNAP